jgi:hypothetical protein
VLEELVDDELAAGLLVDESDVELPDDELPDDEAAGVAEDFESRESVR